MKDKIVIISTMCSGLCIVIIAITFFSIVFSSSKANIVSTYTLVSDVVRVQANAAIAFGDKEAGKEILSELSTLPDIINASILTTDGYHFSSYNSSRPKHSVLLATMSDVDHAIIQARLAATDDAEKVADYTPDILYLSSPINIAGNQVGILTLTIDRTPLKQELLLLSITVLPLLLLSFILAYLLANRLQASATKPLKELFSTIRDVTKSGDYTRRVPNPSDDEIGLLAVNFNFMLKKIEQRDRELGEAVSELKKANKHKSVFLANMSHEIRTPMNGILGITSLLLEMQETDKKKSYYRTIDSSGKSLMHLIDGILDLSKIEAGNFVIAEEKFSLHEMIDNVALLFEPMAQNKNIQTRFSFTEDTPAIVVGDSGRLRQVIINLVGNALKFTEEGDVSLSVSVMQGDESLAFLFFEVVDTGIGIHEDSQKRIFLDFIQADDSSTRGYGGTGLGLSVSKSIVDLMHGEIGVESTEGEGSRFWFKVPLNMPSDEATDLKKNHSSQSNTIQIVTPTPTAENHLSDIKKRAQYDARILVVDDSETNQFILIETLKKFGIVSVGVNSGAAAIEALQEDKFDLVVMDIQMPLMSGIETTAFIRASEQSMTSKAAIPIIAFSANAMDGDRERFLQAGMDDYLSKPMQIDSLDAILKTWLRLNLRSTLR